MTSPESALTRATEIVRIAVENGHNVVSFRGECMSALEKLPPEIFKIKELYSLDVKGTKLDDNELRNLPSFPSLYHLNLSSTLATDKSIVQLLWLPRLERLELSNLPVTDLAIQSIAQLPQLQHLRLSRTNVSGKCLDYISKMPLLEILDLSNNDLESGLFEHLAKLRSLEFLKANNCNLNDGVIELIAEFPRLTDLSISNNDVLDLRPLRQLPMLVKGVGIANIQFRNTMATKLDPSLNEISIVEDHRLRTERLFEYLKDWVPPPDPSKFPDPSNKGLIFRTTRDGQIAAATTPPSEEPDDKINRVHPLLRTDVQELLADCPLGHNTFGKLGSRLDRYLMFLGETPDTLDPLLLWKTGIDLRNYLDADDARIEDDIHDLPPLGPDRKSSLKGLIQLHNVLSAAHPDLSQLDNEAVDPALRHMSEANRALIAEAIDVFAAQVRLIVEDVRNDLRDIHNMALGETPSAARMAAFEEETLRNLIQEVVAQAVLQSREKKPGWLGTLASDARGATVGAATTAAYPAVAAAFPELIGVLEPYIGAIMSGSSQPTEHIDKAVDYIKKQVDDKVSEELKSK